MKNETDHSSSAQMPPPIPAFSWMGSLSPLHLIPIGALILLALCAPLDVLDRSALAKALTTWMVSKWPIFSVHANSTQHQQVALLVNCFTAILIPPLSLVWFLQATYNFQTLLLRSRLQMMTLGNRLFLIVFAAPLTLLALYWAIGLPGDPSWANGFTTRRRIGMAVLNGIGVWMCSLAVGSWPFQVWMFFDVLLRKNQSFELRK